MELNEYAMIVALARLCGVTGTKEEVFQKFKETYDAVCREPSDTKPKTEIFQRPI
ncbi:hypothetical protein [Colidextribacter sp. OB.20]|uniref:hypothetical protein n=1 Tax=Colidextribacter sp. OB.20 TaxID=2304568 RepID=UPI00137040BD|nr:hypothetical protein [Colidextribacter sp. OB.20]